MELRESENGRRLKRIPRRLVVLFPSFRSPRKKNLQKKNRILRFLLSWECSIHRQMVVTTTEFRWVPLTCLTALAIINLYSPRRDTIAADCKNIRNLHMSSVT